MKLPVVFTCENNSYQLSVPLEETTAVRDIADRASSYSIPGAVVDGNDVLAVYQAASDAIVRARNGLGPTLIECKTYRLVPHMAVLREDRPVEEIERWREKDPVLRLERELQRRNLVDDDEIRSIREAISREIELTLEEVKSLPDPSADEGTTDVYAFSGSSAVYVV